MKEYFTGHSDVMPEWPVRYFGAILAFDRAGSAEADCGVELNAVAGQTLNVRAKDGAEDCARFVLLRLYKLNTVICSVINGIFFCILIVMQTGL
jgi:hypothetical protein